jgi:hypothetical protein
MSRRDYADLVRLHRILRSLLQIDVHCKTILKLSVHSRTAHEEWAWNCMEFIHDKSVNA